MTDFLCCFGVRRLFAALQIKRSRKNNLSNIQIKNDTQAQG
jgi:hypothetical protein